MEELTPRLCKLCGHERETRVCPTCGVDLESGDLVAAPQAMDRRGKGPDVEWTRRPARPLGWFLVGLGQESARGLGGTVIGYLLLSWTFGFRVLTPLFALYVLAWILIERCRAARFSPCLEEKVPTKLMREKPTPVVAAPEEPPVPEEAPSLDDLEDTERALRRADFLWAGVRAMALMLAVGFPLTWWIGADLVEKLQEMGQAGLLQGRAFASISFAGTLFVVLFSTLLMLRSFQRSRGTVTGWQPTTLGLINPSQIKPYDPFLMGSTLFRAIPLTFLLGLCGWTPWGGVAVLILLPVLLPALAYGNLDDWLPWNLWRTLRTTPGYVKAVILTSPMLVASMLPLYGPDEILRLHPFVSGALATATATLAGVVPGIAQYEQASGWVREVIFSQEEAEADPEEARLPDRELA